MRKGFRKQDFTFVLVRPRYPGNIGAAARALKNMGFPSLRLVRPSVLPTHPEALRLAVGAAPLLKRARIYDTLPEALADCDLVVATTCRAGKRRPNFISLNDLPSKIPPHVRVGITFGPEERGLTNRELALAQLVATIPTDRRFTSINLAQAVILTAYQLHTHRLRARPSHSVDEIARAGDLEEMYHHLEEMLSAVGFFPHENSFRVIRALRLLFNRACPSSREVATIRGVCRQVLWRVNRGTGS